MVHRRGVLTPWGPRPSQGGCMKTPPAADLPRPPGSAALPDLALRACHLAHLRHPDLPHTPVQGAATSAGCSNEATPKGEYVVLHACCPRVWAERGTDRAGRLRNGPVALCRGDMGCCRAGSCNGRQPCLLLCTRRHASSACTPQGHVMNGELEMSRLHC